MAKSKKRAKRRSRGRGNLVDLAMEQLDAGSKELSAKLRGPVARAAASIGRAVDRVTGKAKKRRKAPVQIEPPKRGAKKASKRKKYVPRPPVPVERRKRTAAVTDALVSGGVRVPRRR